MTKLSININKFALLRNARGTNHPDLVEIAKKCINFGAQGITLHPRPDERHAKFSDLPIISKLVSDYSNIEFNIDDRFRMGDVSYVIQGDINNLQIKKGLQL